MIGDRYYMRDDFRSSQRSATVILIILLIAAFALQQINLVYLGFNERKWLALSPTSLTHGYLWQLVTFQFLHGGLIHCLFNCVGLYFFGRVVEERLGPANMLRIYFGGGLAGGLLQALLGVALPTLFGHDTVGASAGVFALFASYCLLEPDGVVLLFFVLPVKARHLLVASLVIAAFFILVPSDQGIAHAAHLGGLLLGLAYLRYNLHSVDLLAAFRRRTPPPPRRELVRTRASGRTFWQKAEPAPPFEDLPPAEFISREVDPILDKISAHGIQSLTPRERRILEQARAKMSKR